MPRTPTPHKEHIKRDFLAGVTKTEIAKRYGVDYSAVRHHTEGMGRVRPYSDTRTRRMVLPVGRQGIVSHLSEEQLCKLDGFARKIGCDTLMEAVLEIVRDELEEM